MGQANFGNDIFEKFRGQHTITVASGMTCAFLGDGRNLREYLVADDLVKQLREAGHIVHFLLFDDDLDPLNFRQLRVAVDKDPHLVQEFEPFCGKPISDIRSPFDSSISWAKYFRNAFTERLASLGCHPTLISVSGMYERGMYAPYIKQVLLHQDRILDYLAQNFAGYQPEKLFWPICPTCGYIDGTECSEVNERSVKVECSRCLRSTRLTFEELRGKLSWKLDCAARWAMFRVHLEPFTKSYLEPKTGSFFVAQGLATTFFGASEVTPVLVGMVTMPKEVGSKFLPSMPQSLVRSLFIRHHRTDLDLSEKRIITEANKVEVLDDLTFSDVVKQLIPAWSLDSRELDANGRELLSKGLFYSKSFLGHEVKPFLANRSHLMECDPVILERISKLILEIILFRNVYGSNYQAFMNPAKNMIEQLGAQRKPVIATLRRLVGQEEGLPNSRFMFLLPLSYLETLSSMIDLYLDSVKQKGFTHAVVGDYGNTPELRMVSGDLLAFDG